jgi:hypothetical protein
MRIAHRLFERRDNRDAAIGLGENRPPLLGGARVDDVGDRAAAALRVAAVIG